MAICQLGNQRDTPAALSGKLLENGSRQAVDVKEGETIVFKKYAPDEVKVGDRTYLVLSADDVMAVIE